jgi:adenylate kinase
VGKKVVYLTGAPASGKTTTVQRLLDNRQDIELWNYSDRLMAFVNEKDSKKLTHSDLRHLSAAAVTPEDIVAVDNALIDFVLRSRADKHVIIDSHPVTREDYGFRCTAFSAEQILALAPDEIWVLYADPATIVKRIHMAGEGRKAVDIESAQMHTSLQASVAISYGISIGKPVYFFDSSSDQDALVSRLRSRLS